MTVGFWWIASSAKIHSMVTHEEIREHIGRKPFSPFRVILNDGRKIDVTQRNQAATSTQRMVVGIGNDRVAWIWLAQVDGVEALVSEAG